MATQANLKAKPNNLMQQHLQPQFYGVDQQSEYSKLLNIKENILNSIQSKFDKENKIFWLQVFAMFIFIYASTCSKQYTGVDLAFFVGILVAIPICARQTGANLNPAVSYSMAIKKQQPITYEVIWIYFKAQVIGAIASMIVAIALNDVYRSPLYPQVNGAGQIFRMILSEAIGVFILIFFVLYATGSYSFIENNGAKYFYISVFVYIGRRFAAVSGNQINLALTISQAFVGIPQCNYKGFKYLIIWVIGDAIGVLIAVSFYNYIVYPTVHFIKRVQKARQQHQKEYKSSMQLKKIQKEPVDH